MEPEDIFRSHLDNSVNDLKLAQEHADDDLKEQLDVVIELIQTIKNNTIQGWNQIQFTVFFAEE